MRNLYCQEMPGGEKKSHLYLKVGDFCLKKDVKVHVQKVHQSLQGTLINPTVLIRMLVNSAEAELYHLLIFPASHILFSAE